MENQLQNIVKEANLEQSKAKFILDKFQNYFEMADDWSKQARAIVVTEKLEVENIKKARELRLQIRDRRIALENTRKELKESSLRESRAIDGISNVLKALLIPIEEHLDKQENYAKHREKEAEDKRRAEIERKMEEERLAKEQEDAKEKEKLKEELKKKDAELAIQRAEEFNRKKEAVKLAKENEAKLAVLAEEKRKAEEELRLKKQKEMKEEADRIRKEEELKAGSDVLKVEHILLILNAIELPIVTSQQAKRALNDLTGHLNMAKMTLKKFINAQPVKEEEEI